MIFLPKKTQSPNLSRCCLKPGSVAMCFCIIYLFIIQHALKKRVESLVKYFFPLVWDSQMFRYKPWRKVPLLNGWSSTIWIRHIWNSKVLTSPIHCTRHFIGCFLKKWWGPERTEKGVGRYISPVCASVPVFQDSVLHFDPKEHGRASTKALATPFRIDPPCWCQFWKRKKMNLKHPMLLRGRKRAQW